MSAERDGLALLGAVAKLLNAGMGGDATVAAVADPIGPIALHTFSVINGNTSGGFVDFDNQPCYREHSEHYQQCEHKPFGANRKGVAKDSPSGIFGKDHAAKGADGGR